MDILMHIYIYILSSLLSSERIFFLFKNRVSELDPRIQTLNIKPKNSQSDQYNKNTNKIRDWVFVISSYKKKIITFTWSNVGYQSINVSVVTTTLQLSRWAFFFIYHVFLSKKQECSSKTTTQSLYNNVFFPWSRYFYHKWHIVFSSGLKAISNFLA